MSSLEKFGYAIEKNRGSSAFLRNNLLSYELHVIKNHIASIPYSYFPGEGGKLYCDREKKNNLEIDPRERNGFYSVGIGRAVDLALSRRDKLVFLYSPPGKASFSVPPPEDYKNSYTIGQLYLMWYDGDKINNIAVSINGEGERWLSEVMGRPFVDRPPTDEEIIRDIIHPVPTDYSIDEFLDSKWEYEGEIFRIRNIDGFHSYVASQAMEEIRKSLNGELKAEFNHELMALRLARDGGGYDPYQHMLIQTMLSRDKKSMPIGGGCSGEIELKDDAFGINFLDIYGKSIFNEPNLSSKYRQQNQSEEKKNTYPCGNCGRPIPYEKDVENKKTWLTHCPHCGFHLKGQCK